MTDARDGGRREPPPAGEALRARIEELLARMTLAEKAGQLTQYFHFGFQRDGEDSRPAEVEAALKRGEVGSLLFVTDPGEINRLQRLAREGSRLGIPVLFGYDVIHGLRTILPVPIALAATWDPDTIAGAQSVAAREARAAGIHWTFAPMVDIARDPRWGRMVEGAGEDPFLGAAVAAAQVRGFQGDGLGAPERVVAGPKHLAGYGAALGGRDYDEVDLPESALWNVHLPPFAAAVSAGAGNVMTAYMPLNGIPPAGNPWLVGDALRGALAFEGFVVSDAEGVRDLVTHGFAADLTDAAARALHAGVDLEMAMDDAAYRRLPAAVEAGLVREETLDASVERILEVKLRLGLLDDPYVDEERARAVLADPAHREVARVAAERAAVLLRNEGDLLPLDPAGLTTLAVIGPLADSARDTLGPWCFAFDLDETVTLLDGIRRRAGAGAAARVEHAPGVRPARRRFPSMFEMLPGNAPREVVGFDDDAELRRAVELARAADVAVVVAGEGHDMIGEGASRSSLELPGRQLELLQAVAATGTPLVLLVMNGRPLDLRWAAANVAAILDVWYPGTQGGTAVANLLFGDASPGGKLPFTWPRTVGQVPMIYAHTRSHAPEAQGRRYWDEESTPLFPFGHGLSYTRFAYDALAVDRRAIAPHDTVVVSVDVTNTGSRRADEVVQLYLHQRHGAAARPVRELKGFRRVALDPGETRSVRFAIGPSERRYFDAAARDWVIDPATFDVWVGGDSTARLTTTFDVVAA